MTITDQSSNGTYVNGIRISPNVPVPVTRNDTVSFAHVSKLNWGLVPRSNQWMIYAIGIFVAIILVLCVVFGLRYLNNRNSSGQPDIQVVDSDSIVKAQQSLKLDSLNKAKQDSISKAKVDSLKKVLNKKKKEKEKEAKPKLEKEKQNDAKQQKEAKKPTRVLG
jgi:pSer/pThr/pTyr-binding forkhead associated (FHA) protein